LCEIAEKYKFEAVLAEFKSKMDKKADLYNNASVTTLPRLMMLRVVVICTFILL
jgi:hypothetical protein